MGMAIDQPRQQHTPGQIPLLVARIGQVGGDGGNLPGVDGDVDDLGVSLHPCVAEYPVHGEPF